MDTMSKQQRRRRTPRIGWGRLHVYVAVLAALLLPSIGFQNGQFTAAVPRAAAAGNPIVTENQQTGTTSWQIDTDGTGNPQLALTHEIEGYASLTSVNKGGQINFMVSLSSAAQYTMGIYRLGYYAGTGGRLMQQVGPLSGARQANCPLNSTTFLVECN